MIPAPFEYARPTSLAEAVDALADPDARPIAGGYSLVPLLKLRFAQPSLLVDLAGLGLDRVHEENGMLAVGAMTTYDDLLRLDALPDAVLEAAAAVGDVQVRNSGTVGGALAHADPASDLAAGAIAAGARARLRSAAGAREVPVEELFSGPFTTVLESGEVIEEVAIPTRLRGEGSAYVAVEHHASGYALAGAAVRVAVRGGSAESCTVAVTGYGAFPRRAGDIEEALLAGAAIPVADAESAYRAQLVRVVVRRAWARALERAG